MLLVLFAIYQVMVLCSSILSRYDDSIRVHLVYVVLTIYDLGRGMNIIFKQVDRLLLPQSVAHVDAGQISDPSNGVQQ